MDILEWLSSWFDTVSTWLLGAVATGVIGWIVYYVLNKLTPDPSEKRINDHTSETVKETVGESEDRLFTKVDDVHTDVKEIKMKLIDEENTPIGWTKLTTLDCNGELIGRIAWSHDGRYLAAPLSNGNVKFWDLFINGKFDVKDPHAIPTGSGEKLTSVAWHNQNTIYSGSEIGYLHSLSPGTLRPLQDRIKIHEDCITKLFCTNSYQDLLLSSSQDGTMKTLTTKSLSPIGNPLQHSGKVNDFCISERGGIALTSIDSNGFIKFWSNLTGSDTSTWSKHGEPGEKDTGLPILCIARISGTSHFVTGDANGNLLFWDDAKLTTAQSNKKIDQKNSGPIREIPNAHNGEIIDISSSDDGFFLATKSLDSSVKLWYRDTNSGWSNVSTLTESSSGSELAGIAFKPSQNPQIDNLILATLGAKDTKVRIWEIERWHFQKLP